MDYNLPHPPSLIQAGLLRGQPIGVDPDSFHAFSINDYDGRRVYRAATIGRDDGIRSDGVRGGQKGFVAIKVVEDGLERRPRNLQREIQLLNGMNHPNILALLNAYYIQTTSYIPTYQYMIFTPFYPVQLSTLLNSDKFLPSFPSFELLSSSLAYQMLSATNYLHTCQPPIAHRDISTGNFVIGENGRIILIDFGIALREGDNDRVDSDYEESDRDGRSEGRREMEVDIGTGSYRAPEILLAAQTYDPLALDLWSLATVLAEFFTPLESLPQSLPEEDSYDYQESSDPENDSILRRATLFDSSKSNIAQLCSIFSLLGTPTLDSWPEAASMRDFTRITFQDFPIVSLASRLPGLESNPILETIIAGMLKISASERMTAGRGLELLESLEIRIDWDIGDGGEGALQLRDALIAVLD